MSQDSRGTHTIQKFIALAATHAEEDILVAGVTGNVVQLSMDSNGTHVVQAIIKHFREERVVGFAHEISSMDNVLLQVACNCHGICVLKALIDKLKTHRQVLSKSICRLSFELAQDPFGNYAISTLIAA